MAHQSHIGNTAPNSRITTSYKALSMQTVHSMEISFDKTIHSPLHLLMFDTL